MNPLDDVDDIDATTLCTGRCDWLDADAARRLAHHPLEAVDTEFPHYVGSMESAEGPPRPAEIHPVFYGCYDWHSAVHSHWSLVRQLRLVDDHPNESAIVASIDDRLTPENVATEVAYFDEHDSFEKPYGWGWLLRLAAELALWDDERADKWRRTLRPLETRMVELVKSTFLTQVRPFRVGSHGNSAFALACILDYADVTDNAELAADTRDTARRFYLADEAYPVEYEPLGWDFVSPALTEADLMRRVLETTEFDRWLDGFLPDLTLAPYATILDPVPVDPESADGVALHLVGLNVAKAWCLAGITDALHNGHPYVSLLKESAADHARYGVDRAFTDDYAGSHWLSSFVIYLLTRNEGGIAPQ